ncbi:hypothetical protein FQ192_16465 [Pseudomonas sp. ANT_J12]|uniref:hypothetical protein n=1 Tax=Pseudomonas sp. ANT_J12 TaxID=2597351 RepID=UPI0011F12220|nr:hypothetical protein [Pseudomonas sp. ANT_J12]KAA0988633.1 hypothetical protein FQ192_16465 [Pseudomonas sp. ANT_J12]
MSTDFTEEEMRRALFGSSPATSPSPGNDVARSPDAVQPAKKLPALKSRQSNKPLSPKLRVTLRVTKEFEGAVEVFVYDANTLSTFAAEQEAKSAAKKKKFKYFEVVSIKPIS